MLTAVFDICSELLNNYALATKSNGFSCFLSDMLFLVWIVDISNILIIFNMCCSHVTIIVRKQCRQVYSDIYNIILFYTYMCYIPHSICDGKDICCMYYFNPDLRKTGPTS